MSISLIPLIAQTSHILAKRAVLLAPEKEKAFQGLVLPERLFEFLEDIVWSF
jgi:hypothetical protein